MSFDGDDKQWICGKGRTMNLQKVSSIVRDIGEPCLHQSPIKVVIAISKMLKPEKWQATFDSDGKVFGFQKTLKSILLGELRLHLDYSGTPRRGRDSRSGGLEYAQADAWASAYSAVAAGAALVAGLGVFAFLRRAGN